MCKINKFLISIIFVFLYIFNIQTVGIVNIENLREHLNDKTYYQQFSLNLNFLSGETDKRQIDLNYRFDISKKRNDYFLIVSKTYAKTLNQVSQDNHFLHLRAIHNTSPKYAFELYLQVQQDAFIELENRFLFGTGLRTCLKKSNHISAYLGNSLLNEYEQFKSYQSNNISRFSHYISMRYQINNTTLYVSTSYFQHAISNFSDYRLLTVQHIKVKLSQALSLFVAFEWRYDNDPFVNESKYNVSLKQGLKLQF